MQLTPSPVAGLLELVPDRVPGKSVNFSAGSSVPPTVELYLKQLMKNQKTAGYWMIIKDGA